MFLIVPVESLAVRCADLAYHALSNDPILAPILDLPSDSHSANSRVLKICVNIGATRSFVIMPPDRVTGVQPGRSMDLLDQLKSLSEASEFCLFANHDRTLQQSLESVMTILGRRIATVTTPTIELKAFYPGRRKAVINLWENQGWHQRKMAENKEKRRKEGHHDDAPPYTRPCNEQLGVDIAGQCQIGLAASPPPPEYAPHASQTSVSATTTHLLPPSDQHNPLIVASNAYDGSDSAGVFPFANSSDEHIFSSGTAPPTHLPEPSLSPNYSADLLSELSRSSKLGSGVATSAYPTEFLQIPRSSSPVYDRRAGSTRARSPSGHIADAPSKKRFVMFEHSSIARSDASFPPSLSHQQPNGAIIPGDAHHQNLLHMMRRGVHISSTIMDVASPRSMLLPSSPYDLPETAAPSACNNNTHVATLAGGVDGLGLELCLTQWIIQAWTICPDAHYSFVTDLLALGSDVSNNDKRAFNERRVKLTTSLRRLRTKQQKSGTESMLQIVRPLPNRDHAMTILPRLISWLYALEPKVSLTAFTDLLSFSQLEGQMLSCNIRFEELYERYVEECACIIYLMRLNARHGFDCLSCVGNGLVEIVYAICMLGSVCEEEP
ncbi:hypothetical protein KCV07_g9539, partial [Aureobasidium melanogenum]